LGSTESRPTEAGGRGESTEDPGVEPAEEAGREESTDQGVGDVDLESVKLTAQRTAEANEFRQTQVFNFADGYFGDDLFVDGLEVRSEALELVGLDAKNALLRFFEPEEPEFCEYAAGRARSSRREWKRGRRFVGRFSGRKVPGRGVR
jgi:hypothetical protein